MVYNRVYDLGKTIWLLWVKKEEMNIDAQRAAVRPNVEVSENKRSYANVTINITLKAKMKVFNDDLIFTD